MSKRITKGAKELCSLVMSDLPDVNRAAFIDGLCDIEENTDFDPLVRAEAHRMRVGVEALSAQETP